MSSVVCDEIIRWLSHPLRLLRPPSSALFAFAIFLIYSPQTLHARVLTSDELERMSTAKTSFTRLLTEIVQISKRPDLSAPENECINSIFREVTQTWGELGSYEYLITIETELTDLGDDEYMKSVLKFAVDKAVDVLEAEHKRLDEVSDQCPRNSQSAGKAQQAIGLVLGTVGILKSIQPRL
jgi:hypothetical protein